MILLLLNNQAGLLLLSLLFSVLIFSICLMSMENWYMYIKTIKNALLSRIHKSIKHHVRVTNFSSSSRL